MTITVDMIYKQFSGFEPKDMTILLGRPDFKKDDVVSLSDISRYKGKLHKELSIFTAQKEKDNYLSLLKGSERTEVSKAAGVEPSQEIFRQKAVKTPAIPMDASIFDIKEKYK